MIKQDLLKLEAKGQHVDMTTWFEVQKFLNREANWLDHENMEEWFNSLEDDLCYWIPIRENHLRREKSPEISPYRSAMFDETKETIGIRLRRNDSGMCWTEDPVTRKAYAVSNIEVFETEVPEEYEVHSVVTLYRSRFERDDSTLMARRKDVWRKVDDEYRLAGRLVLLMQSTLMAKNLSSFF